MKSRPSSVDLVPIPRVLEGDTATIEMLLRGAGLLVHLHKGFGEESPGLFIRRKDLGRAKELLADYRVTYVNGKQGPIPW